LERLSLCEREIYFSNRATLERVLDIWNPGESGGGERGGGFKKSVNSHRGEQENLRKTPLGSAPREGEGGLEGDLAGSHRATRILEKAGFFQEGGKETALRVLMGNVSVLGSNELKGGGSTPRVK